MKLIFSMLALFVIVSEGCKYNDIYEGNPVPTISNVALNQADYRQFLDTVVITFDYKDGDGDLGFESADSLSVEVKDIRFAKADYYHLKPLAPLNSKISISGSIKIHVKNIFLLSGGSSETTKFQIRIKDRSQRWSNTLVSKSVNIKK